MLAQVSAVTMISSGRCFKNYGNKDTLTCFKFQMVHLGKSSTAILLISSLILMTLEICSPLIRCIVTIRYTRHYNYTHSKALLSMTFSHTVLSYEVINNYSI